MQILLESNSSSRRHAVAQEQSCTPAHPRGARQEKQGPAETAELPFQGHLRKPPWNMAGVASGSLWIPAKTQCSKVLRAESLPA
eukprot:scaffold6919_cov229-Prasinococcus_capsulatus_cf.AAC.1